jgi:uncharacterized protein with PQ loop repeat
MSFYDKKIMEYLYFLSAPLLLFSGFPQTWKLYKTKSSVGISKITYGMTLLAVILLFLKSLEVRDATLILSNGVSLFTLFLNFFLLFLYDQNR